MQCIRNQYLVFKPLRQINYEPLSTKYISKLENKRQCMYKNVIYTSVRVNIVVEKH
jgi:hypothetical protein